MHKVLKAFPCAFDGVHSEDLQVGDERDFGSMADGLKRAGLIGDIDPQKKPSGTELRDDGPTVAEFVARGYLATNYPPTGYASRSTPEEIEAAIKAEDEARQAKEAADADEGDAAKALEALRAELAKQTVAQLREAAAAENIELADGDNKDAIIGKIADARLAPKA